jgi:SAM-dependent methyltransferase
MKGAMTLSPNKMSQYFGKDLEAMSFAINYHKWIMDEFYPYLGSFVAEVGAGTGNFSRLILETHIKSLNAYEPSKNMYPLLKEALSQDKRAEAIKGFFSSADTEEGFDSILYVNVLEHIKDDASELANAHKALNLNGHLLIFVPALPWLYSDLDKQLGHFRRYVKKDLADLTKKVGFTIVKARYFDIAGIIPWYVNFVLLNNSIRGGSVSLYDRLVVPLMRLSERLIPPPIGKNVLLIAKKT